MIRRSVIFIRVARTGRARRPSRGTAAPACKSASKIDPHRRPTWTHLRERFHIFDEWFIGKHCGSPLHADGGSQAAPIHILRYIRDQNPLHKENAHTRLA
jgi:hypothetical protein